MLEESSFEKALKDLRKQGLYEKIHSINRGASQCREIDPV